MLHMKKFLIVILCIVGALGAVKLGYGVYHLFTIDTPDEAAQAYAENEASFQAVADLLSPYRHIIIAHDASDFGGSNNHITVYHMDDLDILRRDEENLSDGECQTIYQTVEPLVDKLSIESISAWERRKDDGATAMCVSFRLYNSFGKFIYLVFSPKGADYVAYATSFGVKQIIPIDSCWYAVETSD